MTLHCNRFRVKLLVGALAPLVIAGVQQALYSLVSQRREAIAGRDAKGEPRPACSSTSQVRASRIELMYPQVELALRALRAELAAAAPDRGVTRRARPAGPGWPPAR